ncbi:MAG: CBS domain-containing protein [Microcystaceae cyanobacterium]
MDLILCHQTADFDAIGAAVGLSLLKIGSKIVLTGGAHHKVKDFLALYRDEFPFIEMRSVNPNQIRSLIIVDNQSSDRIGKATHWLSLPHLTAIELYDHHMGAKSDINSTYQQIEDIGATTTLIVEQLQQNNLIPNSIEATVMALGIHVDTGSLTFEQTTPRDALALAWLMQKGAKVKIIANYADPGFPPQMQQLFRDAIEKLQSHEIQGYKITDVLLETASFIPGLSNLTERLIELTESDALLFGHYYSKGSRGRLTVIGRTRIKGTNLSVLFSDLGGGGHPQAASLNLPTNQPNTLLKELLNQLIGQIPHPPTARELMSSPVRTIRPQTTIEQAQRVLFRYGHSGLSVVNRNDELVGVISRRDIDLALHHGFSHVPVKGYMTQNPKIITPDTNLPEIESIMVTYDIGRLPVIEGDKLLGIVTRTDILRQIHQDKNEIRDREGKKVSAVSCLFPPVKNYLAQPIWDLLVKIGQEGSKRGWNVYLVGGAVRDILLAQEGETLLLQDIDLVVDGFHRAADVGSGVELANRIKELYPNVRVSIHGEFQTAALLWHKDANLGSLCLDIATARTEFYPYPAANPQVEASSIRQDLYRRDFTINALAVRLTSPKEGELLDFFGGVLDVRSQLIRVLHANSFIEDPTRIYRAVRFAVRLNFTIEKQTELYIRYAIESGVYERLRLENHPTPALTTRLKTELNLILESNYWKSALQLLANLDGLKCLHRDLQLTSTLWWQVRCISRWLRYLDSQCRLDHWLLRLEILLADLGEAESVAIATNLQLPKDSIIRLQGLSKNEKRIQQSLPHCQQPSAVYKLLKNYKLGDLILVAARSSKAIRNQVWFYLTRILLVKSPLNGNDLKAMGYNPSPKFKQVLEALLWATLDGNIRTKEEGERFVKQFMNQN